MKPSFAYSLVAAVVGFSLSCRAEEAPPASPTRSVPYLGIATLPAPAALTAQLKLNPGIGLVVGQVAKNGPAFTAGIQENDLLIKLNDQLLIDPGQLSVLVRTFQQDEMVSIMLIRGGETKTVPVKIALFELPLADTSANPQPRQFSRMESFFSFGAGQSVRRAQIEEGGKRFELQMDQGGEIFTVRTAEGKELFHGKTGTPEELEKVPSEYREKREALKKQIMGGQPLMPKRPQNSQGAAAEPKQT